MKKIVLVFVALLLSAVSVQAQSRTLSFPQSPDHSVVAQGVNVVASYELVVTPQGGAALPAVSLAKPAPVSGVITVNVTTYVNSLPAGTYTAVVRAVGPGGSAVSPTSDPFTLAVPAPAAPGKPVVGS